MTQLTLTEAVTISREIKDVAASLEALINEAIERGLSVELDYTDSPMVTLGQKPTKWLKVEVLVSPWDLKGT